MKRTLSLTHICLHSRCCGPGYLWATTLSSLLSVQLDLYLDLLGWGFQWCCCGVGMASQHSLNRLDGTVGINQVTIFTKGSTVMEVDLGIELQYMYTTNRNAPILLNIKR